MATYVVLSHFTDQGIRTIKNSAQRASQAAEEAKRFGCEMKEIYWTLGQYDIVLDCRGARRPKPDRLRPRAWLGRKHPHGGDAGAQQDRIRRDRQQTALMLHASAACARPCIA